MARKSMAGLVAAVAAGALLGALSRVMMRLVAVAAGSAGDFSLAGSVVILVVYAVAMLPGALLAAVWSHRLRWLLLAAGAVFLCFPAVGVASDELGDTNAFSTAQWSGVVAASVGVFLTIALVPVVTLFLVDRLVGRRRLTSARLAGGGRAAG